MYLPRRHSRRLLLPPGWVALGFLLLLGCQALLAHRRQMQVPNILRLQMPIPERMATALKHNAYAKDFKLFTKPLADIKPETCWNTVNFDGRKLNDFVNGATVATAVQSADADTVHATGVKVYFLSGTTYSSLVSLLDLMKRMGHQSYWFDIEHQPTSFYIVNEQAVKREEDGLEKVTPSKMMTCYIMPVEKQQSPTSFFSFWEIYWEHFANLWQQPWRHTAILIATIAALSLYRLARPHPSLR